ncbi:MAG TPA: class I SAM-dependent methyltransferase, partial [Blastocatellia bacterium]
DGIRYLAIPDFGLKFDIILAFSVFTHTHLDEMIELVAQLREKLAPEGILAFTFTDPSFDRSEVNASLPSGTDVRKVLAWHQIENPSLEIEGMVEAARRSNWCLVIDETLHVEPGREWSSQVRDGRQWESYCSYFNAGFISTIFPDGKIFPPVNPEWQHCCILPHVA